MYSEIITSLSELENLSLSLEGQDEQIGTLIFSSFFYNLKNITKLYN